MTESVAAAEQNIQAVARLQAKSQERRTPTQRLGDAITIRASRESTILLHVVWFVVWIAINTGHTLIRPFDPFPYALLTTLVSLEVIFLTLFVLASENRLTQEAERRGHLDLQVNLLAEQEMTLVLTMLKELCEHFNLSATTRSEMFRRLIQQTDVAELAERVERNFPLEQIPDREK